MSERRILAAARFKYRSDTLVNWEANNPILLEGEAGVVTGLNTVGDGLEDKTQKIKFGDGIHDWNSLDWWYGPQGEGGPQGIQGEPGKDALTDQTYDPESENAQSGKALAPVLQKKFEPWQPLTEYKVGDIVIATIYESDMPCTVCMLCIKNHASPEAEYPSNADDFNKCWNIWALYAHESLRALQDGLSNEIHTTYATKTELIQAIGSALEDEY